ncbi:MAG: hypothetical protein JSW06_11085 [Thermoplasmatales archaeon]|nr:MAG: hypothetical protein JSW06_11085 [Thermoplasmatales archaeon]
MHKVDVMYDIELEYLFDDLDDKYKIKINKDKEKNVKIPDKLFYLMLKEGLIKKTKGDYVFVGQYKDTLELKKKKH